jgi:hypothetical protein
LPHARKPDRHERKLRRREEGVHADQENNAKEMESAHRPEALKTRVSANSGDSNKTECATGEIHKSY